MKASDVLAGQKFDALEIKKIGTAETAPESPVGQMETKTTKASELDTNLFGLREKAEHWRTKQLQDKVIVLFVQIKQSHFLYFCLNFRRPARNTIAVLNLKLISIIRW